ncbi:hypothetical protein A3Q56_03959 [Intoshia linei]|uniref:Uncharacterized protein n=1 Tax=Intoshia linei TaxID=1819745 RepID=A0A177B4F8_9BILA|nr:hypothetical protein A3Q56_03959 [Intoshia linei]
MITTATRIKYSLNVHRFHHVTTKENLYGTIGHYTFFCLPFYQQFLLLLL